MTSTVDLCTVPAAAAPEGLTSNFVDPPTLTTSMIAVTSILVGWATIFVATRYYINVRKLGWSDYFALAALLFSIAILGLVASMTKTNRHIWDTPACFFDDAFAIYVFVSAFLLNIGSFFAKASIFLLFFEIFKVQRFMRIAIWVGMAFNFLLYGIGIAIATYYDTPRSGETWMTTLDGRTLIPLRWWQVQSGLIVLLDFYIFILPLPAIARLNMPLRKQIPVIGVFAIALLGIGASIASLTQRIHIARAIDQTWISTILTLCSVIELNIAIIVGCAPAFASFSRTTLPKLSIVKSLLASLSSSRDTSRIPDSEKASSNMSGDRFTGRGSAAGFGRDQFLEVTHSSRAHSEESMGQTHDGEIKSGVIVRTFSVEQQVLPMSRSGEHM